MQLDINAVGLVVAAIVTVVAACLAAEESSRADSLSATVARLSSTINAMAYDGEWDLSPVDLQEEVFFLEDGTYKMDYRQAIETPSGGKLTVWPKVIELTSLVPPHHKRRYVPEKTNEQKKESEDA